MTHAHTRWMSAMLSWTVAARQVLSDGFQATFRREQGQDIVEYALLTAAISTAALLVIILVGPYLRNEFQDIVNGINAGNISPG